MLGDVLGNIVFGVIMVLIGGAFTVVAFQRAALSLRIRFTRSVPPSEVSVGESAVEVAGTAQERDGTSTGPLSGDDVFAYNYVVREHDSSRGWHTVRDEAAANTFYVEGDDEAVVVDDVDADIYAVGRGRTTPDSDRFTIGLRGGMPFFGQTQKEVETAVRSDSNVRVYGRTRGTTDPDEEQATVEITGDEDGNLVIMVEGAEPPVMKYLLSAAFGIVFLVMGLAFVFEPLLMSVIFL